MLSSLMSYRNWLRGKDELTYLPLAVASSSIAHVFDPSYLTLISANNIITKGESFLLVPFPVEYGMVLVFKIVVLFEQLLDLVSKVIRAQTRLGGTEIVLPLSDPHFPERRACQNGVLYHLEERGLEF